MKDLTLNVEGMTCMHCVKAVETALGGIGVKAKADLKGKTVSVSFEESQNDFEKIKKVIEGEGYSVK